MSLLKMSTNITTSAPLPVGTTINGVTGTFTGGDPENTTYRYRWRTRPVGGSWANGSLGNRMFLMNQQL